MSEPQVSATGSSHFEPDEPTRALAMRLVALPHERAAAVLAKVPEDRAGGALALITPTQAIDILARMPAAARERVAGAASSG